MGAVASVRDGSGDDPETKKRLQRVCAADIPSGMRKPEVPLAEASTQRARVRPSSPGMAIVITAAALFFLAGPANAQSPLIQGWLAANEECKGGPSDNPKTKKACETRDRLNARLKRRGCTYQEDGDWWKCRH
jgi:hypothetical protein